MAGVAAGQIYTKTQAPEYIIGHAVSLGSTTMANIGILVFVGHLRMLNNKEDRKKQELEKEGKITDVGECDHSIYFKYLYRGQRISGANVYNYVGIMYRANVNLPLPDITPLSPGYFAQVLSHYELFILVVFPKILVDCHYLSRKIGFLKPRNNGTSE
jgi:hypothetical protein